MTSKKPFLHIAILSVSVCLALASIGRFTSRVQAQNIPNGQQISSQWEIAQAFKPQNRGAPPSTAGAGVRSGCVKSATPLTALMPGNILPLTVEENPTFLVYIPETQATMAEFVLKDDEDRDVFRRTMPIPATAGIFSFKIAETIPAPKLELGKNYQWFFALICQEEDRREDVFVDATMQRTTLSADVLKQLEKASPNERAGLYANNGIWFEAASTLAELRRDRPKDVKLAANWQELLQSVGLEKFASQPLLHPATQPELN